MGLGRLFGMHLVMIRKGRGGRGGGLLANLAGGAGEDERGPGGEHVPHVHQTRDDLSTGARASGEGSEGGTWPSPAVSPTHCEQRMRSGSRMRTRSIRARG